MNKPVIFFDNVCMLCSRAVHFVYKNDRKGLFYFSSFGSVEFNEIRPIIEKEGSIPDSVVLFMNGKVYTRSSAVLRIAWKLRFPLPLLVIGFILPPFLRNGAYDWIARQRYNWFGKLESCFVPEPGLRERFLG